MITAREVTYEADGLTMTGYLSRPDNGESCPAVLICHDGVGLHDYQRRRADDLAHRGHVAFAMDYHGGQSFLGDPPAMLARVMPLLDDADRLHAIGLKALDVLSAEEGADPDRLGVLGYGAGGNMVLEMVRRGLPCAAAAAVHPDPLRVRTDGWTGGSSPILLLTGSEDPICRPGKLSDLTGALHEAGRDWVMTVYGEAKHAF